MVQCRLTTFHGNDPKIPVSSSRCRVTPCGKETPSFNISRILVVPKLKVADVYVDWPRLKRRWPHLRELDIPAIDTNQVGCFIGINVPKALLQLENGTLSEEEPIGILTQFGWSVISDIPITCMGERLENCQALSLREDKADEAIQELWTPEFFTSRAERQAYSNEQEKRALKILETTVRYLGDRYEIGLPWKSDDVYLPNNLASALRRLYATESRFQLYAEHGRRYTKAIEANMKNGFARRLTKTELEGPIGRTWYVPHFLVTHQNKQDKPRLVFDAASRHNGVSLNDALINGPSLLTDLHDLLVIFRVRPCAVSMDIEKMFLQVRVKEEDQSAFRFLWSSPGSGGPPLEFQMMVEIFGASSSPTSCACVLRQTGKDNPAYGDVSEKIIANFTSTIILTRLTTSQPQKELSSLDGAAKKRRLQTDTCHDLIDGALVIFSPRRASWPRDECRPGRTTDGEDARAFVARRI
ncbi:uncharacterized protein LOC116934945 [Daphnia magna]|uniref:uncharacterized protein LOC116934945 n=1 Tax=Daphnia magna TaxID=35525 RepID=UPI001E1BAACD|nr:uncharacterized protein LOC116934945 [Daphnia magna]